MMKTLYLLRRPPEDIAPALFLPSEADGDVVLLSEGASSTLSHSKGQVFSIGENDRHLQISYDDLIAKLFQNERVIVI